KRAYCLKTQPATGETYPKSDLFNKAILVTYKVNIFFHRNSNFDPSIFIQKYFISIKKKNNRESFLLKVVGYNF
ncbi:hypothetical protein, partial [Klebsiella pneumoniae]|uniref:hypothetical protein n=1 Tax=Klebsiella pneumoniae TaxID=573 RepID=UPI0027DF2D99